MLGMQVGFAGWRLGFALSVWLLILHPSLGFGREVAESEAEDGIQIDGSLEVGTRSHPLGGYVGGRAGVAHLLWGGEARKAGEPDFGYIRLAAEGYTALSWNQATLAIELAPHAALVFRFGVDREANQKAYRDFDCDRLWCTASLERRWFEVRGGLPLGRARLLLTARLDDHRVLEPAPSERLFLDITSSLPTRPSGDRLSQLTGVLVWPIDPNLVALLVSSHRRAAETNTSSKLSLVSVNKRWRGECNREIAVTLGAGHFQSSELEANWLVLARLNWVISPSIGLL